jgi:alpha-D-ribose 1-methylphosphonate 5-phosphate C-P lyase
MPAIQVFSAGREKRIYAIPPYTAVESLDFDDYPFEVRRPDAICGLCGSPDSFLVEVILDNDNNRMHVCSDTAYCDQRQQDGHIGPMHAKAEG